MRTQKIENDLLATHISENADFEQACLTGDATKIVSIINYEMEKHDLHTKGAEKLKKDILNKIKGQSKISLNAGQNILFFVWNSRLSGTGLAVC